MNLGKAVLGGFLAVCVVAIAGTSTHSQEKRATVKGYVIDSSCMFTKGLKKPISAECAQTCAKAGSALVILADNGTVYWPISDQMPATGQNERLMKYAGQMVTAKGKVFERGGSHAMVIEEIEAAPPTK
jgi:hypothetical protein